MVYRRFIRARVASHPDCMDRWKWGQRLARGAHRRQKSSVTVRGSRDPSRTRIPSAAPQTASISAVSSGLPGRSRPQEEISMPVRTISRYPSRARRRVSSTAASRGRERTGPRA